MSQPPTPARCGQVGYDLPSQGIADIVGWHHAEVMSLALKVVEKTVGSYMKALIDPEKRRALQEAFEDHVLSELPRIVGLLEERCADLEARGCTPEEANIISHQVFEAQKRTLNKEKRERLTNVLINGFAAHHWDKVTHRLMVRYAVELEEEHIERLKTYASDEFHSYAETEAARKAEEERLNLDGDAAFRHWTLRDQVDRALDRELLGRMLLDEQRILKMDSRPGRGNLVTDKDVRMRLTALGKTFLEYLRIP